MPEVKYPRRKKRFTRNANSRQFFPFYLDEFVFSRLFHRQLSSSPVIPPIPPISPFSSFSPPQIAPASTRLGPRILFLGLHGNFPSSCIFPPQTNPSLHQTDGTP
ncbi:hypothetical protein ACN38_g2574 [Penicillium nordicum]|uniref:Uncharacterized protein n=1 Tax=Penicillium nordicum TaxID=229535 RepID=A0A0M9WIV8_9EURO|nr:hypothetical protein ACN38_g2574 [Penicillium nordicum]